MQVQNHCYYYLFFSKSSLKDYIKNIIIYFTRSNLIARGKFGWYKWYKRACIKKLLVIAKRIAKIIYLERSSSKNCKKTRHSHRWCIITGFSIATLTLLTRNARLLYTCFIKPNKNKKERLTNINFFIQIKINFNIV